MYIAKRANSSATATNGACFTSHSIPFTIPEAAYETGPGPGVDGPHPPEAHSAGHTTNINVAAATNSALAFCKRENWKLDIWISI